MPLLPRSLCLSLLLLFLLPAGRSYAQHQPDSLSLLHSPRKASVMSAILPGAGQAYNKKYWKIPVIYAGFGVLGYFVTTNNRDYKVYKEAYRLRLDGDPNTIDKFVDVYADQDLVTLKDFYRRNRDLSIIGISVLYILNIVDASVDAHLFHFNVTDDLSMRLEPRIQTGQQSSALLGLTISF